MKWDELGRVKGGSFPGQERPNPFARMMSAQGPQRRDPARRRPANPFSGFMMSPYGNDSTATRPSFSFIFRMPRPQRQVNQSFVFDKPISYKSYRIALSAPCAETWSFGDLDFYQGDTRLKMVPSHNFKSAWMSAGKGEEWIYVGLGVTSTFNNIELHWIKKASAGSVQVSEDAKSWTDIAVLPGNKELTDDIKLSSEAKGRYVRVLMTSSGSDENYVLSELEVFCKGGLVPAPKAAPKISDNLMYLILLYVL